MVGAACAVSTPRIVIIEHDNTLRWFLKQSLNGPLARQVVGEAATGAEMVRTVLNLEPDVVVFDVHLSDMSGLDALRQILPEHNLAAVALVEDGDQDLVRAGLEENVLACLVKPVEAHQLEAAVLTAWARFEDMRRLRDENASLRRALRDRKVIEQAKGILMKRHAWSEAQAYRRLQRSAMNDRTPMVQLALAVLNGTTVAL